MELIFAQNVYGDDIYCRNLSGNMMTWYMFATFAYLRYKQLWICNSDAVQACLRMITERKRCKKLLWTTTMRLA